MESIKLQEFVENTLIEISKGIHGANEKYKDGPGFSLEATYGMNKDAKRGIEFDIALTATKDSKDTAGFVISLVNLGGGMKTESGEGREHEHRIKFQVGISKHGWM